jgi:hypothetical protein
VTYCRLDSSRRRRRGISPTMRMLQHFRRSVCLIVTFSMVFAMSALLYPVLILLEWVAQRR